MQYNINAEILRNLNACSTGYIRFIKQIGEQTITLAAAISLSGSHYSDKLWIINEIVDKELIQQWYLECFNYIALNAPNEQLEPLQIAKISEQLNNNDKIIAEAAQQASKAVVNLLSKDNAAQQSINIGLLVNLL